MEFKLFATDHQLSANNYVHSFDVTMNYDNDRSMTATANVTISRAGTEEPLLQAQLWHDSLPADATQINPGYMFVIDKANMIWKFFMMEFYDEVLLVILCVIHITIT